MKKNEGITLIALVITIIVLLILAGVTLSLTLGENGILQKARTAKIDSEIAREKEQILLAMNSSFGDDGKNAKVIDKNKVEQNLQATEGKDNVKVIADIEDDDSFYVKFIKTNRYYEIDLDRNVTLIEVTGGEKNLKLICVNSTNTVLFEKTYIILKDNFSKKLPQIEGYMPPQERITGTITQDEEMKVTYYLEIPESDLIFTGLDKNGNITNDSSKIVSYMIGDNSNNTGNGIIGNPTVLAALKVPKIHNGKPITKIGQKAFYETDNIVIINISDNVESLGTFSFYHCSKLQTLIIGKGLNVIDNYSFANCSNLKRVIYNNETTALIGDKFGGCANWTEIEVNSSNSKFKVVDNILCSKDGTEIIRVPVGESGDFVVASNVKKIASCAFQQCNRINSLDIGAGVTNIESLAVSYCTNLNTVTIRENLTNLSSIAFMGCSNLTKVIYNNTTNVISNFGDGCANWTETEISNQNSELKVENGIIYNKDKTKIVRVPTGREGNFTVASGVKTIGTSAFYYCTKLTSIDIGSEVTNIESLSFGFCRGITTVTIGNGLTSLSSNAFAHCSSLKKVIYNNETTAIASLPCGGGCTNWTEIEINSENEAFKVVNNILYSKDGTKIIRVPTGKEGDFVVPSGVTTIGSAAFYNCTKLTSIDMESDVTTIQNAAFNFCSGITTATIGNSLTSLVGSPFAHCSNLKTVIISSPTIASGLTNDTSCGYIVNYATTVYTNSIPGAYIINNFNVVTSDKTGYTKYVKK